MWGIILSCLATIFACIWVAIHPNVPTRQGGFVMTLTRVMLMVAALVTPEIIIFWAMRQNVYSRKFVKESTELAKESTEFAEESTEFAEESTKLTMAHGFLIRMRGIVADDPGDNFVFQDHSKAVNDSKVIATCEECGARVVTIRDHHIKINDIITIKEKQIADKSKGDILSKGFAALQTSWFVMQCIARVVERLPITQLELVTIGYAILNIAAYIIWLAKPLKIGVPFKLPGTKIAGDNERPEASESTGSLACAWGDFNEALLKPFRSNKGDYTLVGPSDDIEMGWTAGVASVLAIISGVVHCFAWNSAFQSSAEKWSWRICSLVATGLPVLTLTLYSSLSSARGSVVFLRNMAFCTIIVSALARTVLLFEAVLAMRSLPTAAYKTVSWTSMIPHI